MPDQVKKKKSWKTTVAGIASGVAILATQLQAVLDDDPTTVFDWKAALGALAVFGIGFFSRDNGVSSEDAGIK